MRRDACPAVAKMMEAVLRLLFTTKDLSQASAGSHLAGLALHAMREAAQCPLEQG